MSEDNTYELITVCKSREEIEVFANDADSITIRQITHEGEHIVVAIDPFDIERLIAALRRVKKMIKEAQK